MNHYKTKQFWKIFLLAGAAIIAFLSLFVTNQLVKKLSDEEHKKMALWAEATKQFSKIDLSEKDYTFVLEVIQNNTTIPVILTDSANNVVSSKNIDSVHLIDNNYIKHELSNMMTENNRIVIDLGDGNFNYIYYSESTILKMLKYFPYVQLSIILVFILLAYMFFSSSRRAEQNNVWVGLTKETAHQLGTPTSSLMGWAELIKEKLNNDPLAFELEKDVKRLEKITERFSKVGSKPTLTQQNVVEIVESVVDYLKNRTSNQVNFTVSAQKPIINVNLSRSLIEWVFENVMKNAIDAMEGSGKILLKLTENSKNVTIDISDTGKGIPKSKYKAIFKPGYTTKTRGWGLGLSLSKRIIEEYHKGEIFVSDSQLGKGTTIRVVFKT